MAQRFCGYLEDQERNHRRQYRGERQLPPQYSPLALARQPQGIVHSPSRRYPFTDSPEDDFDHGRSRPIPFMTACSANAQQYNPYGCPVYGECQCQGEARLEEDVRRNNADVSSKNSRIDRATQNVEIHPKLTKRGDYPAAFTGPKRFVDFMKMPNWQINEIMLAYNFDSPRWTSGRDNGKGRWARKPGSYPVSIDQLNNLESLFHFLGAHFLATELNMLRHNRKIDWVWDRFRIKRS